MGGTLAMSATSTATMKVRCWRRLLAVKFGVVAQFLNRRQRRGQLCTLIGTAETDLLKQRANCALGYTRQLRHVLHGYGCSLATIALFA